MWRGGDTVASGPDLPAILGAMREGGCPPELDRTALADVVTFGTPLGRRTLVRGVLRLHPGEGFSLDEGRIGVHPSRPLPAPPLLEPDDREGWIDTYLEALQGAIAVGGRVGCALSGGLDSRTLLALLRSMGADPIAITFGRPGHPDLSLAREVATRAGVRHHVHEVPPDGPLPQLDEIAAVTGGTGNLALLAGVTSHREVAGLVDVLVSGASGDALFGPLPALAPDDPDGLHAALPPLRDDRRRRLLPDATPVEERWTEARTPPAPTGERDALRLEHQLRWRQARLIADGLRLRGVHTPAVAPFLDAGPRAIARSLPDTLRQGRILQRLALERVAPDLAALPLVPDPRPPAVPARALRYLRGRAAHLARNLWLRGTPDRGALFDVQTALRTRPAWREAMEGLCAAPPSGIDPAGLRRLWRRHRRGRDNLGLLFGRLLVLQRFVERWL